MIYYNLNSRPDLIQSHYTRLKKDWLDTKIRKSSLNRYIKKFIEENLYDIITGEPERLKKINNRLKRHSRYKRSLDSKIRKIFDYKSFSTKNDRKYDAYDLARKLDVRTCLYCNRMYTVTVGPLEYDEKKITRPQFDHFFDKNKNPLLGLSIFNLVPSCSICNSTLKGKKEFLYQKKRIFIPMWMIL